MIRDFKTTNVIRQRIMYSRYKLRYCRMYIRSISSLNSGMFTRFTRRY